MSSALVSNGTSTAPDNLASTVKPSGGEATQKVKPCCVCTNEKQLRDECMLFSNAADPQEACKDLVGRYRTCMAGYGFKI